MCVRVCVVSVGGWLYVTMWISGEGGRTYIKKKLGWDYRRWISCRWTKCEQVEDVGDVLWVEVEVWVKVWVVVRVQCG